ncbi:SpoIID/LytB domain-containing protein [Pseudanabaena sp. FACHB-1277]|jgi:stage II sporulation protein D|uniref:SpoIID/LytB domain-containing protein n=2 Tax=Pseudanabaena TaxID=1152 RepID=A0A926Z9S5_9CYAN|nr:SpoIID/LytB domain-containing protein [Pseudanabaena cinerea FACHB-1277]
MMKDFSQGISALLLSLILVLVTGVSPSAAAGILRVLVKEDNSSKMSVAVTQPSTLQAQGQPSRRLDPGQWYTLPLTSTYRIIPSNNGLVQVGSHLYPGEIELRAWNNKAIAVNVLSLEEYLRSVVPSEMPASWHMDALMAQAVAARSYAVNTQRQRKWGDAPYDLVSDTRDQVYKGFYRYDTATGQAIALIHSRSDQAVASTAGYMLRPGFKGYYRARLPRNWISWGGGYMPVSDGQHLDQEMTQQMAQSGWNWVQILSWWYRDQPIQNN